MNLRVWERLSVGFHPGYLGQGQSDVLCRVILAPALGHAPFQYRRNTLPYPPGVLCVVPGEVWGGAVLRYFLALEEGVNMLPGFSPELQGVYSETDPDGIKRLYGYVLKG